jgi:large subunit ribosomal protein L3
MKSIFGQKIGMTRVFTENGDSVGVTVVKIPPATVVKTKTVEKDGYNAVVLGFGDIREKLLTKPAKGQFAKSGVDPKRNLREVRIDKEETPEAGEVFGVDIFKPGERVHVTGISRGHGFQGVVKRHGFRGGPKTHGQSDRLRAPGSIGQSSTPSRVFKGMRMAGHMGNKKVTVKNLTVVAVESEQSLLLIKGVVPGHKNSMLCVRKAG